MADAQAILGAKILVVDDKEANVVLLERMLQGAGYSSVTTTTDPRAVPLLYAANRYDLVLLDLHMPGMSGFEVIEALQAIETGSYLPVLVITAQPEQKLRALALGAKDFIAKPFDLADVLARVRNMLEVRLLYEDLRRYNETLAQRVREKTADLQDSYLETIFALTRAAEHRDEDTGAHVQRISYYSRELAAVLGLDCEFTDRIFFASPMHDIGKIGVGDHVLLKPGGFTPAEWDSMKAHAEIGAAILGNSKSPYLQMGAEIALNHHERWDGGGYPAGRKGNAIPLAARIMNICDVYDALRSKRPYKPALDHARAVEIVMQGDGRTLPGHFDPAVLDAFGTHGETFREIFATYTH